MMKSEARRYEAHSR